ncbi:glycosyltransferase family 2 protein [Patescibacteria group bacterium]|nr:glycosyltransferase family 2 protein [Patescibacteria group bacterium]
MKKLTLSIGIPAFNEEENIINLLESIFFQDQRNFKLEQVFVISDGSSDRTEDLVKGYIRSEPRVILLADGKRIGKALRLNQIYTRNTSDLILTLDADVLLDRPNEVALIVAKIMENERTVVVAGHQVALKMKGFVPTILHTQAMIWNKIRVSINGGDHIANLFGSASLLKKDFSKRLKYPKDITADEEYLYVTAKKQEGFAYCKETRILCRTVNNIHEQRLQASRFRNERHDLEKYFGKEVVNYHKIPFQYKLVGVIQMFIKSPVFTVLAVALSLWLRLFPEVDYLNKRGMWLQAKSTKAKITRERNLNIIKVNASSVKKNCRDNLKFFGLVSIVSIILLIILIGVVKGAPGNPNDKTLNNDYWKDYGPIELSPDRGRFALTYSIAENNSVSFSLPVARFATPDLGYKDGYFVSLFAPGVSFVVLPGYLLGRIFNGSQIGTFLVISVFAFINFWLIYGISKKNKSNTFASLLAAGIFSLATPALSYGGSLYQHHISTFLILFSLWLLITVKNNLGLIFVWLMIGASVAVDNPNFFLMFPIGVYALGRIISFEKVKSKLMIKVRPFLILTTFVMIIPLVAFMYFNFVSYGSPFQLSGTVEGVQEIDASGRPTKSSLISNNDAGVVLNSEKNDKKDQSRSAVGFFETRNMLNGFYTQFFSQDRGILFYSPIILFGFIGLVMSYKKTLPSNSMLVAILIVNLIVYTMWGDPWGGWAFGARYLIPAYAILAIYISTVLSLWNKKSLFLILFYVLTIYSVGVNTIGALTSNRNPPKVEVLALEKITGVEQKYTVERNWDYLQNDSKSFVYRVFLTDKVSSLEYFYILFSLTVVFLTGIMIANYKKEASSKE